MCVSVCLCGDGIATGGKGQGGPKGEEDALAFFVGLFPSLFKKKKNNNNLLPSHLRRFSASWDRRRRPEGKAKPSGKGRWGSRAAGSGGGGSGKSHTKAGSEAGDCFGSLSRPRDKGRATQAFTPPSCKNPL